MKFLLFFGFGRLFLCPVGCVGFIYSVKMITAAVGEL
jgi:hypothetical protein